MAKGILTLKGVKPMKINRQVTVYKRFAKKKYPAIKAALPLCLGVHKQMYAERPDGISLKAFRRAMRFLTSREKYLRNMVECDKRFALDGSPAGTLSEEHKSLAAKRLASIEIKKQGA